MKNMYLSLFRFGIEMVPNEPEGPSHMEEEDVPLCEGFHWDSLFDFKEASVPSLKRSVSESSVVADKSAASCSLLNAIEPVRETPVEGAQLGVSMLRPLTIQSHLEGDCEGPSINDGLGQARAHKDAASATVPVLDREPVDEDSSCMSGTEQNDWQSGGKKRRAVGVSEHFMPSLYGISREAPTFWHLIMVELGMERGLINKRLNWLNNVKILFSINNEKGGNAK